MKQFSNLFSDYSMLPVTGVEDALEIDASKGLTDNEVLERRKIYKSNELQAHRIGLWSLFVHQVSSPFIYILLLVATASFLLQNHVEGFVIIAIVMLNTVIGLLQEYRAQRTAELLKHYLIAQVKVIRNGKEVEIVTQDLVPGDSVILYPGDIISADIRIIWAQHLTIDESVLTGESLPIKKDAQPLLAATTQPFEASNIGFVGTTIVTGKCMGIVFATGNQSSLGKLTMIAASTVRLSGFAKIVARFSTFIVYLMLISLAVIFTVNVAVKGSSVDILELILFASALAVSVIPEALPLVMTFALSQGALRLARQKMVVKRLSAIEDLGNIEILCTDKTGTLTENVLTVADCCAADTANTLFFALLAGNVPDNNTTAAKGFDTSLYQALSHEQQQAVQQFHKISEIPFDPTRLRSMVIVHDKQKNEAYVIVRGAFEGIINHCPAVDAQEKARLMQWIDDQGDLGNRAIAISMKKIAPHEVATLNLESPTAEDDLMFMGLVSFNDPLKKSAIKAVKKAQLLGLHLKILSGDSKQVCAAVAYKLGIIDHLQAVITGAEFAAKTEAEKKEAVKGYNVFARVLPEHKYEIIKILQEDHDVGYLGDGINDILALKEAFVGIAVQDAVDVARDAADIIILKKSLLVIVEGIQEGRRVFANTLKYLRISLSINFGNFYSIGAAALFLDFLPLLPVQILLINFLTDLPMIAIATDTVEQVELTRPAKYDIKGILILATFLGITSSLFDFVYFGTFIHAAPAVLQTGWFIMNIVTQMLFIFSIRTAKVFFKGGLPSATLLVATSISTAVAFALPFTWFGQYLFSFTPAVKHNLVWIMGLSFCYFCVSEIIKNIYYYLTRNSTSKLDMA